MGAPLLLAFADVGIDFSEPSLCIRPKPAVKDGVLFAYRDRKETSIAKDPVSILLQDLEDFLTKMSPPGATHQAHAARDH